MIFYTLGLVYEDNEVFKSYTVIMMYVNVACTCGAQVILSFIFSLMSEPLEIFEKKSSSGWESEWEVKKDGLSLFKQTCKEVADGGEPVDVEG